MEEDNRSPAWGGATLGLIVGLVLGFFRDSYWQTVWNAVVVGALLGWGTVLLSKLVSVFAR